MEIEGLGPEAIQACLKTGSDYLEKNREILDNLNVYPVPDGDTGINMVSTFKPAVEKLAQKGCSSLADISEIMKPALTGNSRGNSGFILAQFFSGFWDSIGSGERVHIDPDALGEAFSAGHFKAVSSLLSPADGTMITIIAAMADSLMQGVEKEIVSALEAILKAGSAALFKTPEQLPLLANAGVVDSGALGFIFIVKGMLCGIQNREISAEREDDYRMEPKTVADSGEMESGGWRKFRYCVELDIETGSYGAPATSLTEDFKGFLQRNGGSIAVIFADSLVRIHIHTNSPEKIIEKTDAIGKILRKKIDDMDAQVAATGGKTAVGTQESVSVMSIVPGSGFSTLFEELGAAKCFVYSHVLPSADDLAGFIEGIESDNVIVLPNNSNIIPAVQLADDLTSKQVHTLLTKSVVDGITAMYGYLESGSIDENIESMNDCIGLAETVEVFKSNREATIGEVDIERGHYFVVKDNVVVSTSPAIEEAVVTAMDKIDTNDRSNISFYYGDDFDTGTLLNIEKKMAENESSLEFERLFGGQSSGLIIAIE